MSVDKWKFCSKCGVVIGRNDQIIVSENGDIYCYKNNCAYGAPEDVERKKVYINEMFCSKCGKLVSGEERKPDIINDRVFCSDNCRSGFYSNIRACKCCGIEI